jgi:hypothetical protein
MHQTKTSRIDAIAAGRGFRQARRDGQRGRPGRAQSGGDRDTGGGGDYWDNAAFCEQAAEILKQVSSSNASALEQAPR